MSYIQFDPRTLPFFPTQLIISLIMWYFVYQVFRKKKEREEKGLPVEFVQTLLVTFIAMASTITMICAGFASAVILGYFGEFYRFTLPAGYVLLLLSNVLLYNFSLELFSLDKKRIWLLIAFIIPVGILILLPCNYYGISVEHYDVATSCRFYSNVALLVLSLVLYLEIVVNAFKISRKTSEAIPKYSFKFFGFGVLFLIFFLAMLAADALMLDMGHEGYTFFLYIGYSSLLGFFVFAYWALLMPPWLKEKLMENS